MADCPYTHCGRTMYVDPAGVERCAFHGAVFVGDDMRIRVQPTDEWEQRVDFVSERSPAPPRRLDGLLFGAEVSFGEAVPENGPALVIDSYGSTFSMTRKPFSRLDRLRIRLACFIAPWLDNPLVADQDEPDNVGGGPRAMKSVENEKLDAAILARMERPVDEWESAEAISNGLGSELLWVGGREVGGRLRSLKSRGLVESRIAEAGFYSEWRKVR